MKNNNETTSSYKHKVIERTNTSIDEWIDVFRQQIIKLNMDVNRLKIRLKNNEDNYDKDMIAITAIIDRLNEKLK